MENLIQVPTKELKPSPFNPRTSFDAGEMARLIASIEASEIHEPLIGRRVNGHIEVVAGHRRLEAAKRAKLSSVPVIVKDMTDAQALEVQIVENEQREDVTELDQARGFKRLMALDPKTYTVEHLAKRIGLEPASVYLRLKLLALVPEAQALLNAKTITAGHGERIARLPDEDQKKVVKWLEQQGKGPQGEIPSVRALKDHIERNVKIDLFGATVAEEQPAVAKRLEELKAKGVTPKRITRQYWTNDKGVLASGDFREVKGKKKCESVEIAANAYGDQVELVDICANKKCKTHWPEQHQARRAAAKATREKKESPAAKEKRLAKERAEKQQRELQAAARGKVLVAIVGTVKSVSKGVLAFLVNRELEQGQLVDFEDELEALGLLKLSRLYKPEDLEKQASDRQLAQLAVVAAVGDRLDFELPKVAKEFGVDLKKITKELQTAAAATAKPEAKAAERAKAPKKGKAAKKR